MSNDQFLRRPKKTARDDALHTLRVGAVIGLILIVPILLLLD